MDIPNNKETEIFDHLNTLLSKAYSPYSKVQVAAAVVFKNELGEQIAYGVNIENVSYGLTSCAERSAISAALLHDMKNIQGVYVMSNQPFPISPCGACRQVIGEFKGSENAPVVCTNAKRTEFWRSNTEALLPNQFHL